MNANFEIALRDFVAKVQKMINEHVAWLNERYPDSYVKPPTIVCEPGCRYTRLFLHNSRGERYDIHSFVDTQNGDVLKAASWKAPAKHARGNIFAPNAMDAATPFGAVYLYL